MHPRRLVLAWRRARGRGFLQITEEFPIGSEHQEIPILADRALVGLETAVEGVELRVLRVGARVDLRGGRIALTAGTQRIPLGIGEYHGALALGGRADGGTF